MQGVHDCANQTLQVPNLTLLSVFAVFLLTVPCAVFSAIDPDVPMSRHWEGSYTYHSNFDIDRMQVTIEKVLVQDDVIHAFGSAKYFSRSGNYVANLNVEWTIEMATGFIVMFDVAAEGDGGMYDTSGSYSGSISSELDSIIAIYKGKVSDSDTGTLKLKAVEALADYSTFLRDKSGN